jgi:Fe-S-cluster containining protein
MGNICLSCGLCCNGVIFGDVKLLPGEDAAGLLALGMPLSPAGRAKNLKRTKGSANGPWQFAQPCAALDGCRCTIYSSRPKYCRQFECALLKNVLVGSVAEQDALKLIRVTRGQAELVRRLLRSLGDNEDTLALGARFRRMAKQFEKKASNAKLTEIYGRLTLAFHELNVTLQNSFYPGK